MSSSDAFFNKNMKRALITLWRISILSATRSAIS